MCYLCVCVTFVCMRVTCVSVCAQFLATEKLPVLSTACVIHYTCHPYTCPLHLTPSADPLWPISSPPPPHLQELAQVAAAAGLPGAAGWAAPGNTEWSTLWQSITQVWASQWNDRAWLSRQACRIPEGVLCMSVLLQQVRRRRAGQCHMPHRRCFAFDFLA